MQPPDPDWPAPPEAGDWPRRSSRRSLAAVAGIGLVVLSSAFAVGALVGRGNDQGVLGSLFSGNTSIDVQGITSRVAPDIVDITAQFPDGLVAGTGMVVTAAGQVLTNNHVVASASAIEAQVGGTGQVYRARVIGTDPGADVALLQLQNASGLSTVSIGSSASLSVGDGVVAIGNALGRAGPPSGSGGRVTALDRTITATDESGQTAETLDGLIEVDASVLPGDSGGPLVDSSGRVVGMDTAASARRFRFLNGGAQGFAIPIVTALAVAQQIRSGGAGTQTAPPLAPTALLGVQLSNDASGGALVVGVEAGSPADDAGIVAGDTIVALDGNEVRSSGELRAAIRARHPGDSAVVTWVDGGGQRHSASVVLAAASA